ncbi:MAG TPA: hypothetical protein VN238_13450 [Solirubrobacteraceae bacterium]|nr:hypothetical protein [Solirubrobacteraceae bacterium]
MPSRPISSRVHGILDYAVGAKLLVLPSLLGTGGTRSGRLLRAAGAGHIAYAALTKYELGVAKVLPFRAHLAIDAASAGGMLAAPWLLGLRSEGARQWLPPLLVGLNNAVVTALTDPTGAGAGADVADSAAASPTDLAKAGADVPLSKPDPAKAVMPEGAEANDEIGARTIGGDPAA